jgi:hypothetical protein
MKGEERKARSETTKSDEERRARPEANSGILAPLFAASCLSFLRLFFRPLWAADL